MSDDKHERIRRRAYGIWERERQTHGLHERHWTQATFEIENEDGSLGARPPAISGADVRGSGSAGDSQGRRPDMMVINVH
ncbi:DUF2934 domain-containing protein [Mesorhizobium sp.]|uniref:DUF2934 domain-containing protein n=1 Tax=Mesorhizobium sp. TaxID=1871066 RepID=UPI00120A7749|nr:DUF2934 domain-containing protein [Mesorhizobium sp.]TIO04202.1 MAG: DUF2934 domain-containing protein [Mesorhizobium sp.]TIO28879.1 MAG: DUF2934 domain-containing protein [Mesorhizobium sp.]TIP07822.1 MAG: DUF2934 domain-containing protein [Mesorhizobium sp.]